MPTYDYECKKCGFKFQQRNLIANRNESECPNCGNLDNDRSIGSGSGFIFKGSGFYETDYKK